MTKPQHLEREKPDFQSLKVFLKECLEGVSHSFQLLKENNFLTQKACIYQFVFDKKQFVLKEKPPYCTVHNLKQILHFRQFMEGGDVRISLVLRNAQGEPFLLTHQDRIAHVEHFIEGKKWTERATQASAMGHTLGNFHHLSRKCPPGIKNALRTLTIFELTQIIIASAPERILRRYNLSKENQRKVTTFLEVLEARRAELESKAQCTDYTKTMIPIHGDYNPTNVLFDQNDQVCGIIDFDDCCVDHPVHDLATSLLHIVGFSFVESAPFSSDAQRVKKLGEAFLQGYFYKSFLIPHAISDFSDLVFEVVAIQLATLYLIKGIYSDFSNLVTLGQWITEATCRASAVFRGRLKDGGRDQ